MAAATANHCGVAMTPVDRAAHLNRWRHRSLLEKAVLSLGMMLLVLVLPPFPAAPVAAAVMALAALAGARVPARLWMACAAAPLGFLLVGAVSLAVQIDVHGLALAPGGTERAVGLVAKSAAGVSCLLFLSLTTPTTDLVISMRRLGLPVEVTDVALLMYRFLFLLAEVAMTMDAAQAARLGHVGWMRRLRSLGLLVANLLPRAMDRARRMEIGLAARGWEGEFRVLSPHRPVSLHAMAVIVALLGSVTALGVVAA